MAKNNVILEKLARIQAGLKVPKSNYNDFGKYHYRSCEDILTLVKPLLKEAGVVINLTDDIEHLGDRYYVKATAVITDVETEQSYGVTAFAREEESKKGMDGSQVTGAASSYARKYALNGLFAIDDTADSDVTNHGQNEGQTGGRQNPPAPGHNPEKSQGKRLSEEGYWNTVAAYATGGRTNDGGDIRDWFISYTKATPADIERFDADVDNYRSAHI